MVLNEDQFDKWVEALIHGGYKQIYGTQCEVQGTEMCFCALGVLGDVLKRSGVPLTLRQLSKPNRYVWEDVNSFVRSTWVVGAGENLEYTVVKWNDDYHKTLPEIGEELRKLKGRIRFAPNEGVVRP